MTRLNRCVVRLAVLLMVAVPDEQGIPAFAGMTGSEGIPAFAGMTGRAQSPLGVPRFERAACPIKPGAWVNNVRLECGYLVVHRTRERPGDGTLRLAVAILHPLTPSNSLPLVLVHGGPSGPGGLQGGEMASASIMAPLLNRAVVVYDQRGAGLSEPPLCPRTRESAVVTRNLPVDERQRFYNENARACSKELRANQLDPATFSTVTNAADLLELRQTLGYQSWDAYGVSYGSRLAQEIMRRDPKGIHSVILSAPVIPGPYQEAEGPLAFQRVMDHLFAACAAQRNCASSFPTLAEDFRAVYDDLRATPLDVLIESSSGASTIRLDGDRMIRALHSRFGSSVSRVPLLISELRRGDRQRAARFLLGTSSVASASNELTNLVGCFESGGPEVYKGVLATVQAQTRPPFDLLINTEEECPLLQQRFATPSDREFVTSDIPTLILTQEFDDRTPLDHGQRIAAHLSHAYLVQERGHSHGQRPDECTQSIVRSFLDNPAMAPDTTCLASAPPLRFETETLERVNIVVAVTATGPATNPFAGTWEGMFPDAPVIYKLDLKCDGAQVSGSLNSGTQSLPIFDGRVDGQMMTFKVTSPDGDRKITFTARPNGDALEFTREVEVKPGGKPGGAAIFGAGGAKTFELRRAR